MCLILPLFTCLSPLSAQEKPGESAEALDDLMLRLLDDNRVRGELDLAPALAVTLDTFKAEAARQRRDLAATRAKTTSTADIEKLDKELKQLHATYRRDVARVLSRTQHERLAQIRFQALGAQSAFVTGLRAAIKPTDAQQEQFVAALVRYEDAVYAQYRKRSPDQPAEQFRSLVLTSHQTERKKLDQSIRDVILSAAQARQLREALGPAVAFEVDGVRPEDLLTELQQRANRVVPRYRQPYPLNVLVRLPQVRELLRTTERENEQLDKCADAWDEAQEKVYASLQNLNPRLHAKKLWEWRESYTSGVPGFEAQLAEILGTERFGRLRQIRLQVCGPQALLQVHKLEGQELTTQQREGIEKTRQQLAAGLQ
jgi:hypothetical protein